MYGCVVRCDYRVDAVLVLEAVANAAGRAVAVFGEERGLATLDVREVDARIGTHEAVLGLADDQVAAATHDAHRLAFDQWLVAEWIGSIDLDQGVLGLGHDLLCDHEDVAVLHHAGLGDHVADVVAGTDFGHAFDRQDLELHGPSTPSMMVVASCAAMSASRMIVSVTMQRRSRSRTDSASAASTSSMTSVPHNSR